MIKTVLIALLCTLSLNTNVNNTQKMEKKNYYCEYCGHKFPTVMMLTSSTCPRHPDGSNKGHHKLYEGTEKTTYTRFGGIKCYYIEGVIING